MSRATPLISIIIPTYNRLDYLKQAVQSVLAQTYSNFEVIIADDCSPEDPTPAIEALQDLRLRVRRNATNLGNGPNISQAFTLAKGKYVASLNDDDFWHPSFLEKLVAPLEANPDLAIAFCDHYITYASGTIDQQRTAANSTRWHRSSLPAGIHRPFYKLALVQQAVSPASSAVLRREAIDWSELEAVGVYWDYYLAYLSCRQGLGAYYCPERLTHYRVHEQSETGLSGRKSAAAKIRKGKSGIFCYEAILADPALQDHRPYFLGKLVEAKTILAIGLIKSGAASEGRSYLLSALRQKTNPRTCLAFLLSLMPNTLIRKMAG